MTESGSDDGYSPRHTAQFYSHPDSPDRSGPRELADHLKAVAGRSVWALRNESGSPPSCEQEPADSREQAMHITGWLHDIGKANPYFQRKLDVESQAVADSAPPVSEFTYHARLGGFLAYYCLSVLEASDRDRVAAYLAVAKHHGQLPDAAHYVTQTTRDDERARDGILGKRETDQDREALLRDGWCWAVTSLLDEAKAPPFRLAKEFINSVIGHLTNGAGSFDEFSTQMTDGSLQSSLRSLAVRTGMVQPAPDELPDKLYDRMITLWSALTLADKADVKGLTDRLQASHLSRHAVSDQIDRLGGSESNQFEAQLNDLRDRARREVVEDGVDRLLDSGVQVGELTLPTGLGKTLTGLEAALKIRERNADAETDARVIYALPYTSIIEQTRDILERTPREGGVGFGLSPFSKQYTIHHHLSDTITTESGEEPTRFTDSRSIYVAEAWRSGLVLTTFTQLFESLTGPSNAQSTKLPALRGSVVILDEPQTIPYRWWLGAARLIRLLLQEYDATVLLMTATQPRLLESLDDIEPVRLVTEPSEYLRAAQRVTYDIDTTVVEYATGAADPLSYEEAGTRLQEHAVPQDSSALAVCNTVASARQLRDAVLEAANSDSTTVTDLGRTLTQIRETMQADDATKSENKDTGQILFETVRDSIVQSEPAVVVGHLSARHTPKDRKILLAAADRLAREDIPLVFVTTQLIEAGVDISFQSVYRDLAPLESIIQAAGRCNRSFEWGEAGGLVTVWRLAATESTGTSAAGETTGLTPGELVYARGSQRTLLRTVAGTLVENTGGESQLDEAALSTETLDNYFDQLHRAGHAETQILDNIEQAQAKQLAQTNYIVEEVPTQDVIVPTTPEQRRQLLNLQDADVQTTMETIEDYVEYRVSVPATDSRQVALHSTTEPLGDETELRVLTKAEAYDVSSGLQLK